MNRVETRVQLLMAAFGSILALAVFTPQLFAEDPPTVPPGANYTTFNPYLTWQGSGGGSTSQPIKYCDYQPACLADPSFCYTPYPAVFNGTSYQSMKCNLPIIYGVCVLPGPGEDVTRSCDQWPTVPCAIADLWTLPNCAGATLQKLVYQMNGCK